MSRMRALNAFLIAVLITPLHLSPPPHARRRSCHKTLANVINVRAKQRPS
jgi:hypothetical protein